MTCRYIPALERGYEHSFELFVELSLRVEWRFASETISKAVLRTSRENQFQTACSTGSYRLTTISRARPRILAIANEDCILIKNVHLHAEGFLDAKRHVARQIRLLFNRLERAGRENSRSLCHGQS